MRFGALVIVMALLTFRSAAAQGWQDYAYPDAGFAVYFPGPPTIASALYRTAAGAAVPATTYSVRQDNVVYSATFVS